MSAKDNLLIANTCCWRLQQDESGLWSAFRQRQGSIEWRGYHCGVSEEHAQAVCLPKYFLSLDDMADAETFLTEKEELQYLTELARLMDEGGSLGWRLQRCYRAKASQRAQAFATIIKRRKP